MTAALQAIGLSKWFGGVHAVSDLSLTVETGTVHAVIGPNGSGKSTLVNLLSGVLAPSDGQLLLYGRDVSGWPVWRLAREGVGRTFQRTNIMAEMSVLENVRLSAQSRASRLLRRVVRERDLHETAQAVLQRVGLDDAADRVAGTLSHGRLRQLEIAIALAGQPKVLLLDEPLAGMGAEDGVPLAALLRNLVRDHAILLVEHDMDVVFSVADRVTVMVDGCVLQQGTPADIRASDAVRDAYLGHSVSA